MSNKDEINRLAAAMRSKASVSSTDIDSLKIKVPKKRPHEEPVDEPIISLTEGGREITYIQEDDRAKAVKLGLERAKSAAAEKAAKMRERSRRRTTGEAGAARREAKRIQRAEKEKNRPPSARTVELWWGDNMHSYFPSVTKIEWSWKQMKLAAELVDTFEPALVKRAIEYIFDNWELLSKTNFKYKNRGTVPDFDVFCANRAEIMSTLQLTPDQTVEVANDKKIF